MEAPKLKSLQVIHTVFCLAIAGFAIVAIVVVSNHLHFSLRFDKDDPYFPLFPILAPIFVAAGFLLFNRQMAAIDHTATGDEKMAAYQAGFLIRCACMEAAALLNTVALLRSGNGVYIAVIAGILVIFAISRPSRDHIIETTKLQFPDTEKL